MLSAGICLTLSLFAGAEWIAADVAELESLLLP